MRYLFQDGLSVRRRRGAEAQGVQHHVSLDISLQHDPLRYRPDVCGRLVESCVALLL